VRDQRRYYDRDYRDYHRWNSNEERQVPELGGKDMKLIVPSTSSRERSREDIGSIVTNIQIETIAANRPVLSPRDNSQDGRSLYDHPARTCPLSPLLVF